MCGTVTTQVAIYYPSSIPGAVLSSGVYPSTFAYNHSSTYIEKKFSPILLVFLPTTVFSVHPEISH